MLCLDSRLSFVLADPDKTEKQIEQSVIEISELEENLSNFVLLTDQIQKIIRERDDSYYISARRSGWQAAGITQIFFKIIKLSFVHRCNVT